MSLASRTSSRTHFEVLGLEGQVLGRGLEALSPHKLHYFLNRWNFIRKRQKSRGKFAKTFFVSLYWRSPETFFWRPFLFFYFYFLETLFFEIARKKFLKTFFWRTLAPVPLVLGLGLEHSCPWPRAFMSLASGWSLLGKAVLGLGLGFFLCPWPWLRALCPRLHHW